MPDHDHVIPDSPSVAYAADVARQAGRSPLGEADSAWLALSQGVWRAACVAPAGLPHRLAIVEAAAATAVSAMDPEAQAPWIDIRGRVQRWALLVRTWTGASGTDGTSDRVGDVARTVGLSGVRIPSLPEPPAGTPTDTPADAAGNAMADAVAGLQQIAEDIEHAGAFALAYTFLASLRRLVTAPHHGMEFHGQMEGQLLAQQGRVARQLGVLPAAQQLYAAAFRSGRAVRAPDVMLRALMGLGVLANMRGNYPDARRRFRQALRGAQRWAQPEFVRHAHQGLLHAAVAAGDVEAALRHGWEAVVMPGGSDEDRAAMFVNLAEVCATAGHSHAALGGYRQALALTALPRIQLCALGGAAVAAAALGEVGMLERFAAEAGRVMEVSAQPYENAVTLVELSEAFARAGQRSRAVAYATRAAELADSGTFYEVSHRAAIVLAQDTVPAHRSGTAPSPLAGAGDGPRALRSAASRAVVRSLTEWSSSDAGGAMTRVIAQNHG